MGTRRIRRGDDEYTLFFRKVSPFSNHHPAEFDCDQSINFKEMKRFSCTEQYYMYNKASLLKECQLMEDILNCDNPKEMKVLCSPRNLRNWCEYTSFRWDQYKEEVMHTGCTAKFRASKHLRFVLFLSTGSKLVECSPFDRVWGIGKDLETALTSSLNSGKNLLGKILDRVREELWNDRDYRDEREEVESRMRKDKNYLLTAMEHIDSMYKGRATQRYLLSQGHIRRDDQSYVTTDILSLIPEWAVPPRLEKDEPIAASPPQFHNFQHAPPHLRLRSISPFRRDSSRLAGRISYVITRPARTERDRRRSRDRRERHRSRSRSRRRSRSRSRSRHDRRRSRSRSRHQRPSTSMQSGQQESKRSERSSHRRRKSRSKSREDRKRRRSRSHGRDKRAKRTRSRSSHRSRRERSRSRSRSRDRRRRHSSRSESPEEQYQEERKKEKKVKRRKLRPNANRSRPLERSDAVREPRSESQEECYQRLKKMRKLLKRRAKEKRKREKKPPSSTSSESEAEKPLRGRVEIASGSSSSTSNNTSVIISN